MSLFSLNKIFKVSDIFYSQFSDQQETPKLHVKKRQYYIHQKCFYSRGNTVYEKQLGSLFAVLYILASSERFVTLPFKSITFPPLYIHEAIIESFCPSLNQFVESCSRK